MPTYAYACTACEHRFEVQQSFSDDALSECPECQGKLRKLFNSVGIVFKGSGFYRTDSRGADKGAVEKTSGTPSTGTDSSSGGTGSPSTSSSGSSDSSSSSSSGGSTPTTTSKPSTSTAGSAA